VRLETDYVTAVALSRGLRTPRPRLADGRLRVSGEVARLAEHAATLSALDDPVRGAALGHDLPGTLNRCEDSAAGAES